MLEMYMQDGGTLGEVLQALLEKMEEAKETEKGGK